MKIERSKEQIWHRVWEMLLEYKKYFPGILLCLVCTSFMTFLQPLIIRQITDQGMVQKDLRCIFIFSGIMIVVSLIQQGLSVIQTNSFSKLHNLITRSLYTKSYWKLNKLRIQYFDEKGSAEIINTINADISNVASVADQVTTFSISSILQIVGGVVGLALLDWKLALLIVLVIPIKFIVVYYFSGKKNRMFEQWLENSRVFSGWLGDCISGIREMKLWNLFYVKSKEFEKLQKNMMNSYKENMMLDEYRTLSITFLDTIVTAILYILSGVLIIKGEFTIGGAFAFITYSGYVVSPISFLINIKYYFAQIEPSAKRLFTFLEQTEESEVLKRTGSHHHINPNLNSDVPVLEFKNVSFGYDAGCMILNNVSFSIQQGERMAIIGENGSGKSTILNLLAGFYRPQQGLIKLYGMPMDTLDVEEIRKRIAVISQKPYLFQGTIEENVNIDGKASHEEVVRACESSGALNFIENLEQGFEQKIGQNGARLSGGERQKLAVARALLKKADILLMDEATAGFDVESKKALHKLLCNDLKDITVIFITHKYEELEGIDKIYRLWGGVLKKIIGEY